MRTVKGHVSVANDTLVGTGNIVAVARSIFVGVRGEELGGHMQVGLGGHVQWGQSPA